MVGCHCLVSTRGGEDDLRHLVVPCPPRGRLTCGAALLRSSVAALLAALRRRHLKARRGEDMNGCTNECCRSWPSALGKAAHEDHDYAVGLRDGTVVRFGRAQLTRAGWALLLPAGRVNRLYVVSLYDRLAGPGTSWTHGIEVRVDSVVWVADTPSGS
jgi:hypothetical protein